MSPLAHGEHVRKVCRCGWRQWPKCPHPWYLSYKPRGGKRYRFSFDAEFGGHVESKLEAEKKAAIVRTAIDDGTFERVADRRAREQRVPVTVGAPASESLTVEQLGLTSLRDHLNPKTGEPLSSNERLRWELVMRTVVVRPTGAAVRFGALPVSDVSRHDIEAFRKVHLEPRAAAVTSAKGHTYTAKRGGIAAVRGCLGRLRAFFSWAVEHDYVLTSPFRKGGQPLKGLFVHEPGRERRLEPGEWERLFAAAGPHLQALMTAAIETGCRVGELLSLQWQQVRFDLNEIHFRAKDTKARRARNLPMSQRSSACWRCGGWTGRTGSGRQTAFVFGETRPAGGSRVSRPLGKTRG